MATGSFSKLVRWRRCRQQAWWKDVKKLQRKAKSIAPSRGTLLHKSLEYLYTGKDWTVPINEFEPDLENVFDEEREDWVELKQECYRIMRGYIAAFKDSDAKHKTIATEVEFEIPLGTSKHRYAGTIDRIYVDENDVAWVEDHKTVGKVPSEKELYIDMQTIMYVDACKYDENIQKLLKGRKIGGVVFNHVRTKAPREPKVLIKGGISKAACDTDVATYFTTVKKHGLNVDDYKDMIPKLQGNVFFKRTKVPVRDATVNILRDEAEVTLAEVDMYLGKVEKYGDDAKKFFTRTMLKNRCSWDCEFYALCFGELAGMKINNILTEDYEVRESRYDDDFVDE